MRIALTGGLGTVGVFVRRRLIGQGHTVTTIDTRVDPERPGSVYADLTDYGQTVDALRGHDAVVHLAAINAPIVAPEWRVHNNNVVSSYNVLVAAAELGIARVVQTSSVNAIGLAWSQDPSFDYFPVDLAHRSRTDDGYSLSKHVQELQADSVSRRYSGLSVVTLRLHAVLERARDADRYVEHFGDSWAINGLWGYCTFESVADAIALALTAPVDRAEVLWVVEPKSFSEIDSRTLAATHYPEVPVRGLDGHSGFFDISRTREVLGWVPSTEAHERHSRPGTQQ